MTAEPYRESGYVLLMEALAARGNVAEALRVFDTLRTLLRDELGTTPSPETIAAHERLLRPDARTRHASGPEAGAAVIDLPPELRARAAGPLVGRRRELGELGRLWAIACGEHSDNPGPAAGMGSGSRIVLLVGDPGIGKTRLVAELAQHAHDRRAVVLAGRGPEEALVPYQPFLEALRHYLLNAPLAELRRSAREYGPDLARLVPELRWRAPEMPPPPPGEPETERYRLFEAVVGLLAAISASAPVLLVIDDLQWADRPTLLLLRHLARAADPSRLLILGAYRGMEAPTGFADTLGELRRDRLLTELQIGGLAESETAELAATLTGEWPSRAFSRALHQKTEGNPFFIEEIVRHLAEAGVHASSAGARELQRFGLPEGVKQVIARRLARLDTKTIEWLRIAAVIGREADISVVQRVSSFGEEDSIAALEEALDAGLVVESPERPGRYAFSHALVRETLYEAMSGPRRERIHRLVGEALESGGDRHLAELAHHFTRAAGADDAGRAIAYARRAGEQASAMLAHEEAAEHFARALEVLERFEPDAHESRCELLLLLGEARVRAGERALAWPAFREAAALAEQLGDRDRLARAAVGAARRYVQQPGVVDPELIRLLERALELTAHQPSVARTQLLASLCGALYYAPERHRMIDLSDEAMTVAQELDDHEARANACAARRRALWDPAHLAQRVSAATEMLTQARGVSNFELELQAHAWLVVDLLEQGERDAVDAQVEAFATLAERLRQPLYVWNALVWRAMAALLEGALDRSEELAGEALVVGAPAEAVTAPQYHAVQLLAIRREQGRMAELEQPARAMVEVNPARPAWRSVLADLLWECGRAREARAELELLAATDFADIPRDLDWMPALALLAETAAGLGDRGRAAVLYEQLLPYAGVNVVIGLGVVCLGSVSRFLGKLAATLERRDQAAAHFEHALDANAALRAPVWVAHTQLDYAALLRSGPRARELVDAAAVTAEELRLPAVARRVGQLRAR
jgi:tetratricopeptide (TPR) repeat protein